MKIIYNKLIPFKGFLAINLFGTLFVRKLDNGNNPVISEKVLNHERIHSEQMKELLYIPFYIIYFIEWLIKLIMPNCSDAYRSISFEREAYNNEGNLNYLKGRKRYNWIKLIFKER